MTTDTTQPSALPLSPGSWTFDAAHSSVGFTIRHLGISKVRGRFADAAVDVTIGDTLDTSAIEATVEVASLHTGNADRDAHTLSPDLLDVATRPQLRFRSTDITPNGDAWRMTGDLTLGAITRPVDLDVEFGGAALFPVDGSTHAGFEATGTIDRHDFGLNFGMVDAALGRRVDLVLDVQLIAPATE